MKALILPNDEKTPSEALKSSLTKIGGIPIFFHILTLLHRSGFDEVIICNNTEGEDFKKYISSNIRRLDGMKIRILRVPSWYKSAKMIRACKRYLFDDAFFVAPNDVITDLNIEKMLDYHRSNAQLATMSIAEEKCCFSALRSKEEQRKKEKKIVNTGFYVFENEGIDYMENNTPIESDALVRIAQDTELSVFDHVGFVQHCV